jgi:hypothetical protein
MLHKVFEIPAALGKKFLYDLSKEMINCRIITFRARWSLYLFACLSYSFKNQGIDRKTVLYLKTLTWFQVGS